MNIKTETAHMTSFTIVKTWKKRYHGL